MELSHAGELYKAITYANDALSLSEKLVYKKGMGSAYNSLGVINIMQSNYPEALKNYLASLKIKEEIGDTQGVVVAYGNIGNVYVQVDNYPEALKNFSAALEMAKQQGYEKLANNNYNNIGVLYGKQGNYAEALKNFSASLSLAKKTGNKKVTASTHTNIGIVYEKQGNYPGALENYLEALKIQKELENKDGIAISYVNLGGLYTKLHKLTTARNYLNNALELSKEVGNKGNIQDSYLGLSQLDSVKGDFKSAYRYHKLYAEMRDSILNEESTEQISKLRIQYKTEVKEKENIALAKNNELLNKEKELQSVRIENQTLTVKYLLAGFLLLAVTAFISFRLYNQKRKATFLQQVSETKMKALRAQMNPHFIYNSINSVYRYMKENDLKSAEGYLISFSKLIRQVLENSLHNEVSLNEELRSLELYLALEAKRMNNSFSYKINVADDIDRENTLLPPLLIEPFVENSIWHGMKNKSGDGKITINIVKDGDMLRCIIEDNGAGRQAVRIPAEEKREKQSLGMKLTEERINTLNQTINSKTTVSVIDLFDEAKNPAGVKVVLSLPLQLDDV